MSACEECWADAQRDVMFLGGSVVDHYRKRIEQPGHAIPPIAVLESGIVTSLKDAT